MPISANALGKNLIPTTVEISARDILAYAAGIGDTGDPVFDDASDQLVAPPQLCVSLEWPVVSHPGVRDLLGAAPDELRRGVHAVQDSVFHRPIRPGDRLVTSGRWIDLRATRAGALMVTRLETVDEKSDEPVVTSWSTSIHRGVAVDGDPPDSADPANADLGAPPLPEMAFDPQHAEVVEVPIPREMPQVYTECARIWNPIHTERRVALAAGLPDIILHGTATWALAGREVLRRWADGDPRRLRRLHGQFRAMVIPGTTIRIEHQASEDGGAVAFRVLNEDGAEAIRHGMAVLG